ncbi:MAG: hypothetical protein LLG00_04700, partial [Planctomycetaceae bacterium]|nr:hypothetical protein [Planctomycetaceae bacterium]
PVDTRADLYSLGAVMYALLSRRPVFRGKSLPDMLYKQRFEQPEPLRQHAPDAPAELEQILAQLLEKDPAKRVANPDILARRFEAMLHALSLGPETLDAGRSWFFPEPPIESEANSLRSADRLADGLRDDVPATQAIGGQTDVANRPAVGVPPALPTPGAGPTPAAPAGSATKGFTPPADRFVAVPEEELDPTPEEEPRPAFSWQTGALAIALLAMGLIAWWTLQPPSADGLYERIAAKTADQSIGSILGAETDIRDFLSRYSGDPRAKHVREYEREIELRNLENRINQRTKGLGSSTRLEPVERAYLEAINYSHLDPEVGAKKLQAILDLYDGPNSDNEPSDQTLILVHRRLSQFQQEVAKRAGDQLRALTVRLDLADSLRATDPAQARKAYRAVLELYAEKPWAAPALLRARAALEKLPEKPSGRP